MKSVVIKRSVLLRGRKTSISLENEFWDALREIARHCNLTLPKLLEEIDRDRVNINLSSAIRVFLFSYVRALSQKPPSYGLIRPSADTGAMRARAEECRALAECLKNAETRAIMLRVAADYELLAERLERDERSVGGQYSVAK